VKTDPRPTLIAAAGHFYQLGWMMGTAGNLSARMPDGSFWITASGRSKGQLSINDFIRIASDSTVAEQTSSDVRPSAETSIHQAIYSLFPDAQACYHVHSIEANLVSQFATGDTLLLPPLEMLKGLGVWEENPNVELPVFANHLEVPRIAGDIYTRFKVAPPPVSVLLIRNHGVTVWASSAEGARNYLEIAEYIFRYMVAARKVGIDEPFENSKEAFR
jgi:methylthioribulose-1-phosphate dehydratase